MTVNLKLKDVCKYDSPHKLYNCCYILTKLICVFYIAFYADSPHKYAMNLLFYLMNLFLARYLLSIVVNHSRFTRLY